MGSKPLPTFTEPVTILDAASDGRGVARHESMVLFVRGAIPGDQVIPRVYARKKKMLEADIQTLVIPSANRISPACEHFGECGGCKWQNMDYATQLKYKEKYVRDAFERIGHLQGGNWQPILGADDIFGYRNKLEFTFSPSGWIPRASIGTGERPIDVLGFHVPGMFDKVLHINSCLLMPEIANRIRNHISDRVRELQVSCHDIRKHEGLMRNLILRSSRATGEWMVTLVTYADAPDVINNLFSSLCITVPEVSTCIHIVNGKMNDQYTDLPWKVWSGPGFITERIGGKVFRIGPVSFFQTNSTQAERLYQVVSDMMPAHSRLVYDLYAGTGSIGIFVSDKASEVAGVEYVESAVRDAMVNAGLNGLNGFLYESGDLKHLIGAMAARTGMPDVVITDPPRSGMEEKVIRALLEIRSPIIIYVSCNPATQARDLALLQEVYQIDRIQPLDMFPHTAHVENVARLILR